MAKNNYIIESMYAKYADMSKLDEARNPENDEINKVIARTAGRRSISPEDKKALQDAGIHRGRGGLLTGKSGKEIAGFQDKIYGPRHGWRSDWDRDNYGDVDFKNYLDKPINNDKWAHDYDSVKALHPYTRGYKEYGGVGDRYNDEKATQEYQNAYHKEQTGRDYLSDEDIEAQAQEYKQELVQRREARANKLANLEQKKHDYVAKAKEQHAAKKKNESLLKEMALPEMALQNAPNKNKTLSASDFKAAMGTVEANFDKFMKDKQYDAAIRFLWNNLKTDYNTHFKSMSSAGNDELVADLKKQYSALFSKATHWWNSLPQKKQEEKKKQELWRMLIDMNKMLSLNESLSLKEGISGSNLWGELFDKAYEYIYDAIWDTLQSIDWLDDDEIDIDDIFVSELSQQLASELCDTVDDRFGEIITR